MDHVKKLVYTIVGCLTIVSLTFTICTKIGHCASSSESVVTFNGSLPFYFDKSLYDNTVFTDTLILNALDDAITRNNNFVSGSPVIVCVADSSNFDVFFPDTISTVSFPTSNNPFGIVNVSGRYYRYRSSNGSYQYTSTSSGKQLKVAFSVSPTDSNVFVYTSYSGGGAVLYVYNYESFIYNGDIVFSPIIEDDPVGPQGHTKGGVLSNYIDSQDLIEDDSSLPSVDTNPPADSTSNSAWYQKILNGMGKINDSIKGGVLTIGDYIGMLKESVENGIAWITEEPNNDIISDNIEPYLSQNDLISGFNSSKTAIQGVYTSVTNVAAKTRSQMVWDIPFNLPSMSQTFHARIDFGWYENIRSTLEPFLNMFLCVGFLFSFIRSIPGILHGNSGEGDT